MNIIQTTVATVKRTEHPAIQLQMIHNIILLIVLMTFAAVKLVVL